MVTAPVVHAVKEARRVIESWDYGETPDYNEKETRNRIVDPILIALGWDLDNKFQCIREYYITENTGRKADYALFNSSGEASILIEAKRLQIPSDEEAIVQLVDYVWTSHARNVTLVTTNGEYWNICEFQDKQNFQEHNPIGLLWNGATPEEQARRLYDALNKSRHWQWPNRGGGIRKWRN